MKPKISLELWLPGSRRPSRTTAETLDCRTFSRLIAETGQPAGALQADERTPGCLSHLRGLDPQAAAEFLESL
ncbi:MAG: hypothetical protein JXQ83_08755 [Candidatus Glassbacteria bacterium]|nr:hypothetical protein [Candidatus Glassbacteria bacterium]